MYSIDSQSLEESPEANSNQNLQSSELLSVQEKYLGINEYDVINKSKPKVTTGNLGDCIFLIVRNEDPNHEKTAIATHVAGDNIETDGADVLFGELVKKIGKPSALSLHIRMAFSRSVSEKKRSEILAAAQKYGIPPEHISQPYFKDDQFIDRIRYDFNEDKFEELPFNYDIQTTLLQEVFSAQYEQRSKEKFQLKPAWKDAV